MKSVTQKGRVIVLLESSGCTMIALRTNVFLSKAEFPCRAECPALVPFSQISLSLSLEYGSVDLRGHFCHHNGWALWMLLKIS